MTHPNPNCFISDDLLSGCLMVEVLVLSNQFFNLFFLINGDCFLLHFPFEINLNRFSFPVFHQNAIIFFFNVVNIL